MNSPRRTARHTEDSEMPKISAASGMDSAAFSRASVRFTVSPLPEPPALPHTGGGEILWEFVSDSPNGKP